MTRSPAAPAASSTGRRGLHILPLPLGTFAAFMAAVLAVVCIAIVSFRSVQSSVEIGERVGHTIEVKEQVQGLRSALKDAETGQRGFLLTGAETYLLPYVNARAAMAGSFQALHGLMAGTPRQEQRLRVVEQLSAEKLDELAQTIELRRKGDAEGALAIVRTDRGKLAMDRLRSLLTEMEGEEQTALANRQREAQDATRLTLYITTGGSALLLLLIAVAAAVASREHRARETNAWVRAGQMELGERLLGEQSLARLGESVLGFLVPYLDAQVGAVYIAEGDQRFMRFAGHALAPESPDPGWRPGDGLLGQVVRDNRPLRVRDVPEGHLPVVSSLGRSGPRELLLAPAGVDGVVHAVIELGFFREVGAADQELLARVSESLGAAVRTSKDRTRLEELLGETQSQAEELQAQQEELRVSNEELEEQGNALKESQVQLEAQQAELEQTNSQLEEQAQLLEHQRDELAQSQAVLTDKAAELERASRYKSEFLANMSHELRTPLNSSLILSKLLADNKGGNLSADQVRFAQAIHAAGKDLLALINDILDLSKIEAGKVEVDVESVPLAATLEALAKSFQPLAQQKGLDFKTVVEPGAPERIETDPRRLGQILKNLLSNAFKFTAAGQVVLRAVPLAGARVALSVSDSGIGIAEEKQDAIFDAFRQADGSTHRKYGGTGLGLSISRELARLLGGDLGVQSAEGHGSVFTLTLPRAPAGEAGRGITAATAVAPAPAAVPATAASTAPSTALAPIGIDDDRDDLSAESRLILVVEDDARFAAILRDLAREMGFKCIVTHTADDGLAAAASYQPSAILLDINLPDHSGLGVLDQLKRNPQTRHIPVHVASVADYSQEALELGAVGYALKPVKREHLVDAFVRLQEKLAQSVKRVLVVEDDARQRDAIRLLLTNDSVQIVAAETAAQALAELRAATFDCMVMDLSLPDLSGYELLERMAAEDELSFPPVIVYTGRSLTRDEEQTLRRFSKSIIIKDARSPERLLDEVTLFIHQVESKLPPESQRMLKAVRDRDAALEGRRILVVEDDVRNIFALSSILEPKGAKLEIARNGLEALAAIERLSAPGTAGVDLVLMDIMMPEMDGITAIREIRKRAAWRKLPIIALTARAMKGDQQRCFDAGANDYIAKPLDVDRLLSLVRVWMPK